MAETAKGFEANLLASLRDNTSFRRFGLQQLQANLKAQTDLLGNLHSTSETYLRHRRQNLEDAATALDRMLECKDLGEIAAIQTAVAVGVYALADGRFRRTVGHYRGNGA